MIYKKIKASKKANLLRKTRDPEDGDIVNIDGVANTFKKELKKIAGESGNYTGGGTFKNQAEKDSL